MSDALGSATAKQAEERFPRKLRMGMVGGGRGAMIGAVHRRAAMLDGGVELVAGAFSSTPDKSLESGRDLYVPEDRRSGSWQEMLEAESAMPRKATGLCIGGHTEPRALSRLAGLCQRRGLTSLRQASLPHR